MVTTMALSAFPVLYFFTFLYYTDPGSTFCVLLMYLMGLQESHFTSAGMESPCSNEIKVEFEKYPNHVVLPDIFARLHF